MNLLAPDWQVCPWRPTRVHPRLRVRVALSGLGPRSRADTLSPWAPSLTSSSLGEMPRGSFSEDKDALLGAQQLPGATLGSGHAVGAYRRLLSSSCFP